MKIIIGLIESNKDQTYNPVLLNKDLTEIEQEKLIKGIFLNCSDKEYIIGEIFGCTITITSSNQIQIFPTKENGKYKLGLLEIPRLHGGCILPLKNVRFKLVIISEDFLPHLIEYPKSFYSERLFDLNNTPLILTSEQIVYDTEVLVTLDELTNTITTI